MLLRVQTHPASRIDGAVAPQLGSTETRAVDLNLVGGELEAKEVRAEPARRGGTRRATSRRGSAGGYEMAGN